MSEKRHNGEVDQPDLFSHALPVDDARSLPHVREVQLGRLGIPELENTLRRLAELIQDQKFEELETDWIEFKPVPSDNQSWKERYRSACALLNTRGGFLILGIKETGGGDKRRYEFSGWGSHAQEKLAGMPDEFTDRDGEKLDLRDVFPLPSIVEFLDGRLGIQPIIELPQDRKFAFYERKAYKRVLQSDQRINEREIERQEEYRKQARDAKELRPVPGAGLDDLDLENINIYIAYLNRAMLVESIKPSLKLAVPALEKWNFIRDGRVTLLGYLVCGKNAPERLGFCCQVHAYVDMPQQIARNKQIFADNLLPLMENALSYILRHIEVGVTFERGGTSVPEYPEALLRETIHNAMAHRDYSIDKHVLIIIKPGRHISIRNPGTFLPHLLMQEPRADVPVFRIIPDPRPRNPKLAHVLGIFQKWEGRGNGMAAMINICLENKIDLPYYVLDRDDITLFLSTGKLLDDRMERLFEAYAGYIGEKLHGGRLTPKQKMVLAYIMKSEWANRKFQHTILLSPGNNHFNELAALRDANLISLHPASDVNYPIFIADRQLLRTDYAPELRRVFAGKYDALRDIHRDILNIIYRSIHFSTGKKAVSAKDASRTLWRERGNAPDDIEGYDAFYRKVRYAFNKLEKDDFITKAEGSRGFALSLPQSESAADDQRGGDQT